MNETLVSFFKYFWFHNMLLLHLLHCYKNSENLKKMARIMDLHFMWTFLKKSNHSRAKKLLHCYKNSKKSSLWVYKYHKLHCNNTGVLKSELLQTLQE